MPFSPLPDNLKNRRPLKAGDRVQCVNWNGENAEWELDSFDEGTVREVFSRPGFGEVRWKRDKSEVRLADGWSPEFEGFAFLVEKGWEKK